MQLDAVPAPPDDPGAIARDQRRARREALLAALIGAVLVGAGVFGVWLTATAAIRYNFRHYMIALAEVAAVQIDPRLHDTLRDPSQLNGPDYQRAVRPLQRMQSAVTDVRYIYTVVRNGTRDVRFVLDATAPGDNNHDGVEDQAALWETADVGPELADRILGDGSRIGRTDVNTEPYTDKWGTVLTAWAPMVDEAGRQFGAMGVDMDANIYLGRLAAARHWALLGLLPAGLLTACFGFFFYRFRLRLLTAARVTADAASRDKLTGLANRTQFIARLEDAAERVRNGRQAGFAVLFLDFDRFKFVNDAMGHAAGDELLRAIAARLQQALKKRDAQVARFGGDEFLVLMNDVRDAAAASEAAAQLQADLAGAYQLRGRELHSTASIGIVTSGQCLESGDAIVHNADLAMYEAKRAGRGCSVLFSDDMYARQRRRVDIENGLREALDTPQITLSYQPIIELATGRLASVEALVRWRHPVLGQVPPDEFIPLAEESGLIVPLGQRVLREACEMLAHWRRTAPETAPRVISVNISRTELALGEQLLVNLREALHSCGLPASCLQLEVTEREVMRDPESSLRLMQSLQGLGVQLAMDDFGTGTSSLSCLRDYPFDVIKIDRSFVGGLADGPDMLSLIHATIALVENLGRRSVAEGVENAAQVAILQSMGCHYGQGFHFSPPVPAQQLVGWEPSTPLRGQAAPLTA